MTISHCYNGCEREKQIMNAKTIKTDNRFTWFTNLATSTAERERIFYYVRKTRLQREYRLIRSLKP